MDEDDKRKQRIKESKEKRKAEAEEAKQIRKEKQMIDTLNVKYANMG